MDIGRVFSNSFSTLTGNFKIAVPFIVEYVLNIIATVLLVLTILVALGASLLSMAGGDMKVLMYRIMTAQDVLPMEIVVPIIFLTLLTILLLVVINGATLAATVGMSYEALNLGETSYGKGIDTLKAHTGSMVIYFFIVALMVGTLGIVAFIPAMLGAVIGNVLIAHTLSIFGLLAALLGASVILLISVFTPQQIVIENVGAVGGLKKSFVFVRDNVFDVILYGVASVAIFVVTFMGLAMIFQLLMLIARGEFAVMALQVFQNLISTGVSLVMVAYFELVQTAMVLEGKRDIAGKDI